MPIFGGLYCRCFRARNKVVQLHSSLPKRPFANKVARKRSCCGNMTLLTNRNNSPYWQQQNSCNWQWEKLNASNKKNPQSSIKLNGFCPGNKAIQRTTKGDCADCLGPTYRIILEKEEGNLTRWPFVNDLDVLNLWSEVKQLLLCCCKEFSCCWHWDLFLQGHVGEKAFCLRLYRRTAKLAKCPVTPHPSC